MSCGEADLLLKRKVRGRFQQDAKASHLYQIAKMTYFTFCRKQQVLLSDPEAKARGLISKVCDSSALYHNERFMRVMVVSCYDETC